MRIKALLVGLSLFLAFGVGAQEPLQVKPGAGIGPVQLGMSESELGQIDFPFNLQDPYVVDGVLQGFSTNTGGSVALGGAMASTSGARKAVDAAAKACGDVPAFAEIGDKYDGYHATWFWIPSCGLGLRIIVIPDEGTILQAWAIFPKDDADYIEYIRSTYEDKSGQRL